MKEIIFKKVLAYAFFLFSLVLAAQTAPDEDTNSNIGCPSSGQFENNFTRVVDIPNSVNVGTVDDRTCYADYYETNVYGETWGAYNITYNSNHWDAPNTLQPRIERSLPRSMKTGVCSYAKFTGTLRILEVGKTSSYGSTGSYFMQAKGKHTGGGGPSDPAICLYLAKPVYGTGSNAGKQIAFDIYAERILERGGSGSGREVVFLKRVNKNEIIDIELTVGFREDPTDSTKKIHYCDAVIGGEAFNWSIPDPERGAESGIRYGAYRVKGGRAQMRWANTTYQKVEIEEEVTPPPTSNNIYRLRNVATRQFLTDTGSSATPVTMTDSGEPQNTHWTFVDSGTFINIDSETYGILRAPGSPYIVLSTAKAAPATDTDKIWTMHYNDSNQTYRFESKTSGRYLYHDTDGNVYHVAANETDLRSVWEAIPTSQSLTVIEDELNTSSIQVFPNPASDRFIIKFNNVNSAQVKIFNMLGEVIYETKTNQSTVPIDNTNIFNSGMYIINVTDNNNRVYYNKLIIK